MILGIDEVGRGPWAGPLVVGAVVLPYNFSIDGLTDSKKLTTKKRMVLDVLIREQALGWGLGWVHADELDELGLSKALRLATVRAVEAVQTPYHEIIIDGTINFLSDTTKGKYVTTMPKADALIPAVSAASIIAKVARDAYMKEQEEVYPEYGFASHVGYGTAKHQKALLEYGVTILHRKSFAPIAQLIKTSDTSKISTTRNEQSPKAIGDQAENAVSSWLKTRGFTITERNWKTKYCEIDIVAKKAGTLYFVEVKYRASAAQGGGVAAVTSKKLQQMKFAAELYATKTKYVGALKLAAVAVNSRGDIELVEIE